MAGTSDGGWPEWELFDLRQDPQEMMNVYHDPAYKENVTSLTAQLDDKMSEIGDEPLHH